MRLILLLPILFPVFIFSQENFDTDGDGIPDKMDKCPREYGIKEKEGCSEITSEMIRDNAIQNQKQFEDFRSHYKLNDLANLMISKINLSHFNHEIIFVSFQDTVMSHQDVGPIKSELTNDYQALNNNIINNVWNEENFKKFLKDNPGKKIVLLKSYGSPTGFETEDFSSTHPFLKKYESGIITLNDSSYNHSNKGVPYYSAGIKNQNISKTFKDDYLQNYSSIYIQVSFHKNTVHALYVYNFKMDAAKIFAFENNTWKFKTYSQETKKGNVVKNSWCLSQK